MALHDGSLPLLSGTVPGVLDSSQPARVLRTATSSLFFAAFDPHTARADVVPNISCLNIDPGSSSSGVNPETAASTNGKRVVIESDAESGTCTWRFVPRAKTEGELLGDEGPWPRVVLICGRPVRMTQDQWDIHKLDPEYECTVRATPNLTTVTRLSRPSTSQSGTFDNPSTPTKTQISLDADTPTPQATRIIHPLPQTSENSGKNKATSMDSDQMAVDEEILYTPNASLSNNSDKKRRRFSDHAANASDSDSMSSRGTTLKATQTEKRTGHGKTHDDRNHDMPPSQTKRFRTRSPDSTRQEMEQKRASREKKRKFDMNARLRSRRDALHQAFWKEVGVVFPEDQEWLPPRYETASSDAGTGGSNFSDVGDANSEPEEAQRFSKIEESRRKLADLEKDKPLWEENARRRMQREAEEELLRKQTKAMREELARAQEYIKAAQRRREAAREDERKAYEREARLKEQRGHMFVNQPRNTFRWNSRLALERYMRAAADFDDTKFSTAGTPLSFALIPWPVLHASFSVQEIDWDTVEAFFKEVERFLIPSDFKELVQKSHRRFHPDRWKSRGLLVSVDNETERDLLEVAGSTVAQALTPLWKEVTGRA